MTRWVHFIGIGGIGMSGVATLLLEKGGIQVSGSDVKSGAIVDRLRGLGAEVFTGHAKEHVPQEATVVVSSDIHEDNPELMEAKARGLRLVHRSDMLVECMSGQEVVAITGSHGKTTTAALLTHVLKEAGEDPSFAVGGILHNLGWHAHRGAGRFFIAEADESDGTFLKYPYSAAIVTNIDTDHIAHFGSFEKLQQAFAAFIKKAPCPEKLLFCGDDPGLRQLCPRSISYGFAPANDLKVENVVACQSGTAFDIRFRRKLFRSISIPLLGRHNVLNASAVFGLALLLGVSEAAIRAAFSSFRGVARRLERRGEFSRCLVVDDYAHHPTEIKATLAALRQAIGERRLIAVFQPHRPSRMKHCVHELAGAFSEADLVVATDLYFSNEKEVDGISSKGIFAVISESHAIPCYLMGRPALVEGLLPLLRPHDVVLFLGAGDSSSASEELAKQLASTPLQKWRVGIIYGGNELEEGESREGARRILGSLDLSIYIPVTFEIDQHGRWRKSLGIDAKEGAREGNDVFPKGLWPALQACDLFIPLARAAATEGGGLQGFLETLNKPYVGCSTKACAVTSDKIMARQVVQAVGVSVVPYVAVQSRDWMERRQEILNEINKAVRPPFFVKPARLGPAASRCVEKFSELAEAIDSSFQLEDKLFVEQAIIGRRVGFTVFGNKAAVVPVDCAGRGLYAHPVSGELPSLALSEELLNQGKVLAKKAYQALGCSGLSRVECLLDEKGHWFFTKAEPCGCTDAGSAGAEAGGAGQIDQLVVSALARFHGNRSKTSSLRGS